MSVEICLILLIKFNINLILIIYQFYNLPKIIRIETRQFLLIICLGSIVLVLINKQIQPLKN